MSRRPALFVAIILAAAVVLAALPLVLPPFYVRFGQLMVYSAGLAVAWTILRGFSGYFPFGHAAFLGVGVYTTAVLAGKLGWPFLATLPAAAAMGALLGTALGAVVFRVRSSAP